MKLAGILLLLLSSVSFGYYSAFQLKARLKAVEDYALLIGEFKNEIHYTRKTVAEIAAKIRVATKSLYISNLLESSYEPNLNDEKLKEHFVSNKIDPEITDALIYFFGSLGKSDLEGQLSLCELCKCKVEQRLIGLREDIRKKAKLVQSLGILFGIAIGIMLF